MADVKVTLDAVICSPDGSTIMGPVKIVGSMTKTGLGVGGGPIFPEEKPPYYPAHPIAPGGERPAHPIAPGGDIPSHPIELPHPEHPIANPPTDPPTHPEDPQWVWGYSPTVEKWLPVYVPNPELGQPGPK